MSTTDCSLFSLPCLESPQILLPFSPNTSRTLFFFHSLVSWFHYSTSPVSPLLFCTAFPSILKDGCPLPCSKDSRKVGHMAPYRNTQQYGLIPPRVVKTWTSCERRNDVPTPRFNLKSQIPQHSWHSPSPWLFPGLVWLLPRPDCRGKEGRATLEITLFTWHCIKTCRRPPVLGSRDTVGFPHFILPTTSTDVFSCWPWNQTFKMFRENSYKSSSDRIGRHTHMHRWCVTRKCGGEEMASLCDRLTGRWGHSQSQPSCRWEASPDPCVSWVRTQTTASASEITPGSAISVSSAGMLNLLPVSKLGIWQPSSRAARLIQNNL